MRKGVLLSLGMLFLSGTVLSIAILLFHNTQGTEARFAELALYDRLYDIDSSVQAGFKEIFMRNSGIELTLQGDIVSLKETLPRGSGFAAEVDAYSAYLEEAYPALTINESILDEVKNSLPIYIMPHNIKISHSSFPDGNLEVTPSTLNIANYSIHLSTTRQSAIFSDSGMTSGSFPLKVEAKTASGTSSWIGNINPTLQNTLILTFDSGLPTEAAVAITIDNPAHMVVDRGSMAAEHNLGIALEHQAGKAAVINLPPNLFTISFAADNLQKSSTARLQ